ncbi:transformer-2 protein [Nematocida homosporus]|uniref:transformer-2 protein n=1 Tax=Nematocida homosporus TaxID=1912981 RepID=UPI00221F7F32|nr:transformer-2 protein [Nematocida homosporus]KAI5187289.1 transformer-2 protein [Nematocida homosporus]
MDRAWSAQPYEETRMRPNWRKRRPYPAEQTPVNVLGLFGLDIKLSEKDLADWIKDHLTTDLSFNKVELVLDRHTGFSRGFAFVYFSTVEEATKAKEQLNSQICNGTPIRVEYSITATGHRKEDESKKATTSSAVSGEVSPEEE